MKLELLVEESMPKSVVEHLVSSIPEKIPVIKTVAVDTYSLPRRSIYTEAYVHRMAHQRFLCLGEDTNAQKKNVLIALEEVGVMSEVRDHYNSFYYNVAKQLIPRYQHVAVDTMLLMATTHRFFFAQTIWDGLSYEVQLGGDFKYVESGFWFPHYKTGVVHLSKTPILWNLVLAAHEIGHGLGLSKHHKGCLMQEGPDHRKHIEQEFCDPCKSTINGVVAK